MSNVKRVIIGSEQNDDRKIELLENGATVVLPVTQIDSSGNTVSFPTGLVTETFDSIELSNYDSNNNPGTIVYKNASVTVATLTLVYSGSNLISVTKS